jgi:hypothetical protein
MVIAATPMVTAQRGHRRVRWFGVPQPDPHGMGVDELYEDAVALLDLLQVASCHLVALGAASADVASRTVRAMAGSGTDNARTPSRRKDMRGGEDVMRFECDQCRRRVRGTMKVSAIGRHLCEDCDDQLLGAAADVLAGGGIPGAVAVSRIFAALKRRRKTKGRDA